jgi:hypothetical protein
MLIAAAWYQVLARTAIGFAFTPLANAALEDPDAFRLTRLLELPHRDLVADVTAQLHKAAHGPLERCAPVAGSRTASVGRRSPAPRPLPDPLRHPRLLAGRRLPRHAGRLEPAYAIGGDTFDWSTGADHLVLTVTDGMGQGIDATWCRDREKVLRRRGLLSGGLRPLLPAPRKQCPDTDDAEIVSLTAAPAVLRQDAEVLLRQQTGRPGGLRRSSREVGEGFASRRLGHAPRRLLCRRHRRCQFLIHS